MVGIIYPLLSIGYIIKIKELKLLFCKMNQILNSKLRIVKMKQVILFISFITFFGVALHAQNLEADFGEKITPEKLYELKSFVGEDESGYYYIKEETYPQFLKAAKQFLVKHNKSHVQEFVVEIPNKFKNKSLVTESVRMINGKMHVFCTLADNKSDLNQLYVSILGSDNEFSTPKLIDEIDYRGKINRGGFGIIESKVNNNLLITRIEADSRRQKEAFHYTLYDKDFNLIWKKFIELDYKDKDFLIEGFIADDENNVFMLGEIPNKDGTVKKIIVGYYHKTDKVEETFVDVGDVKKFQSITLTTLDGNLLLTGISYDENEHLLGVFMVKINSRNLNTIFSKHIKFPDKDRRKLVNIDNTSMIKVIGEDYVINEIKLLNDGGMLLMVEHLIKPRMDIMEFILVRLNSELNYEWLQFIPFYQSTQEGKNTWLESYAYLIDNKNLYMVYNTNVKNLALTPKNGIKAYLGTNLDNYKNLISAYTTIDLKSGETNTEGLFKGETKEKSFIAPTFGYSQSEKKLLMLAKQGKGLKFGVINLK